MLSQTGSSVVALKIHHTSKLTKPWYLDLSSVSEADVMQIDRETVNQSSSSLWYRCRVGRVTGSISHRVLHTSSTCPAPSLISDICTTHKLVRTPAILWGRMHESDALSTYEVALGIGKMSSGTATQISVHGDIGKAHTNVKVSKCGFRVSVEKPFIGASCDAYVSCDCCGAGVVEAKCPYNWGQDGSMLEQWLLDPKGHLHSPNELKKGHPYYTQV